MMEFVALVVVIAVLLLSLCAWILYDSKHNTSGVVVKTRFKKNEKVALQTEDDEAKHLKDFLLQIYDCGVMFTLSVSKNKPKKYMGLYYPSKQHITVYSGWCECDNDLKETAIHEYAHHICFTCLGAKKREVHDKRFWQVYSALVAKAVERNLYRPHRMPILKEIMH